MKTWKNQHHLRRTRRWTNCAYVHSVAKKPHSHQSIDAWKTVIHDTLSGISIDKTADKLGLSHGCVFNMRHKVLMAMEDLDKDIPVILEEVSELDETYVLENMKGTKDCDGRRAPRKRGEKAGKRGLSEELICICSGVQRQGPAILKTVNRSQPSKDELKEVFEGHITEETMAITDGAPAYRSLQENEGCKVVNAKKQDDKFYHLNNVNSLHSYFKSYYRNYRGVATKYINRYNTMIARSFRPGCNLEEMIIDKICDVGKRSYVHTQDDIITEGLVDL